MNTVKTIQRIFIKAKIVKGHIDESGNISIFGIDKRNPLAYVALFVASIIGGVVGFFAYFNDVWKHGYH